MNGLPIYDLRTRDEDGVRQVWDRLRKKWLVLTPEEHVRQCLVEYLVNEKGVPQGLISQEKGLSYDRRRKRYDLVVYGRDGKPLLACECKAPYVPLDGAAGMQLAVYNRKIGAPFLLWTNGQVVVAYGRGEDGRLVMLREVWGFEEMEGGNEV